MSELKTVNNIKIPYPTEGVIRTAQLDDTIAPENSVQLAVNMNFDRVGAIQTRLGVTEYATSLAESISNFGTLRNSITPPGYDQLFQIGETNELADLFSEPTAVKVSDTKTAVFWSGEDNDGFCQNFETDIIAGSMLPIGTPLEFDIASADSKKAMYVTASIVLLVWTGSGKDGFAQCFDVSGESIVAMGTALEFDTSNAQSIALAQVDSTHFICFYEGPSDGLATIFAVNTTSGAVTEPGATLTFSSGSTFAIGCAALGDGTHFITFWHGSSVANAQVFVVNTGTWAISALSSPLNYGTNGSQPNPISVGDGSHFVNIFQSSSPSGMKAQTFAVNLSTFAVTQVGTGLVFGTSGNDTFGLGLGFGDGENFLAFYSKNVGDGYVQMLHMDPTSFDITAVGSAMGGYDFANGGYTSGFVVDETKVFAIWGNVDALEGRSAMFQTFGDVEHGRWLYASHGDEVSNWPAGGPWTSRRSGLQEVSKPRFAQYLGYIWMVNGNDSIGGDPVATSNGGDFGTDLVPEDFPKGDFISAGFEGRVWVANKTLGILYYTDIVQFVPPYIYTLSYNPDVNFITTIAPQSGEQFTALYEVPRALLAFTENTITRIYGATSIDAYPAYNVGTYSQESIIETKTGIFFHHSSGFYQFDYGSQPIEISRRVIDFVRAIPRSYYGEINGVYDGFDCVEWSVGQVIVDGVVFANCVMRYTISTQVWTIYDYPTNVITAMIEYDDETTLNHLIGTSAGLVGAMDTGFTDFGVSFYYEYIDRWRSYTDMYCQIKSISGVNVYSENAAGANVLYQVQKSGPNAWKPLMSVTESNNSLAPNAGTIDFDVMRIRVAGTTSGVQVVIHGIEITTLTIKGFETN